MGFKAISQHIKIKSFMEGESGNEGYNIDGKDFEKKVKIKLLVIVVKNKEL